MEIEKEERSLSVIVSESSDDEISRHLENSQLSTPNTHASVNIHGTADLPLPFGFDEGDDVIFIDPSSREGKRFLSDPETTVPEIFAVMRQSVSPVANHIDAVVRENGADIMSEDECGRTPESCLASSPLSDDERGKVAKLQRIFHATSGFFTINSSIDSKPDWTKSHVSGPSNKDSHSSGKKKGLQVGDYVLVNGTKRGCIKFIGNTKFSPGIWCGVQLDDNIGKNDGSINGIRYFTCEKTRGVFAPLNKVTAVNTTPQSLPSKSRSSSTTSMSSRHISTHSNIEEKIEAKQDIELRIGMTVMLDKTKEAKIRFIGETDFATGFWIGLSFAKPIGKNNGTVQGREYFRCKPKHGMMVRRSRVSVLRHAT